MSEVKNYSKTDLPDNWEMGEFSKDLKIQGRIGWKGYKTSDLVDEGPIVVGGTEIKSSIRLSLDNVKHLSREKYEESPEIMLKEGDVLLVTRGNLGEVGYYHSEYGEGTINPSVIILKNFKGDSKYLFYYLISSIGRKQVLSLTSGSSIPAIYQSEVYKLNYPKPPITEQKSIAAILTSFDDKIELLQAQNKTLEELAQTIFKEWFGKYKVGDELPEGWRIDKLEKIANHSKKNIKPFENPDAEYHHYSLPAYDNGLISVIEKGEMIKSNKYLVESNSFLVSKLNPFTPRIWTIFEAQQNFICSTEFQVIKPKEKLYFAIIHCFLNSDEFTSELSQKTKGTSSSHQRVNPQDIFDVELVIPTETDLLNFNSVIYPLLVKKNIIHQQIQTLTKTRDELLPKLMSGEIRVKMSEL